MTLNLSLPTAVEDKLKAQAAAAGKDIPTFVQEAVEEKLASAELPATTGRTPQQWESEFNAWIASHKPVSRFVDDSRESIYAGRGE